MTSLTDLTLLEAVAKLRSREITSLELTQACLDQINRLETQVHAFITRTDDLALEMARAADARRAAAASEDGLPPLLGLPLAIKDVLAVKDVRATCGSKILENFVPPYTATSVKRLLEAGIVVVGKTNTDEFAMGSSTENSAYGQTYNPWDLNRVPGGSSGGSAAAVAARMIPGALGTDTGGSVRQPAAYCGVTGLKPTYGRVSRYGLIAYGSSLDCVGAFGRTAADVATLFAIMAGHDPLDATSMDLPAPQINLPQNADLKGLRIGVPQEYFIQGLQAEVEAGIRQAVAHMCSLGAEVKSISLPHTSYALPVYYLIAPAEASANLARYDGIRFGLREADGSLLDVYNHSRGKGFGQEVKRRIMLGTYALSAGYYDAYYGQAQKVRTLIKRDFEQAFESVDVIATPVAPTTAFRMGEHSEDPLAMYLEDVFTLPTNLAGVPGLSFPVGFDQDNMPIGMQLMGPHYREDILFQVAHAYQQTTDWHLRKPALA